jgi:uncharacterized protein
MLIEFRVENHRSLRDEQVFTMEAGRSSGPDDSHVRAVEGHKASIVTAAALYGANASGKSNLLSALTYMCDAVKDSYRLWEPGGGVPRDPFAWGEMKQKPSLYEVTFLRGTIKYQYGFVVDDAEVLEEWLYAWPGRRKQTWFEREQSAVKFGDGLKGDNRVVEDLSRHNALLISAAAQHGHSQLMPVYEWFGDVMMKNVRRSAAMQPRRWRRDARKELWQELTQALTLAFDHSDFRESWDSGLKSLLLAADVGIVDAKIEDVSEVGLGLDVIYFRHEGDSDDAWVPLSEESAGTQKLFDLAKPLLYVLANGGMLVVDELERSLHPLLAAHVLRQFTDARTNPKNAQIVFTTHDTNLLGTTLGEPGLARDQVWLTEKQQNGGTVVYPLTDFKPRKAENIERGYLQGRYGAIPFLGDLQKLIS